jgi:hypothetical protein
MKVQYEGTFKITKVEEGDSLDLLMLEEINNQFVKRLQAETGGTVEMIRSSIEEVSEDA